VKPNIHSFRGGRTVRFADGSEEEIDLAIWCTGYKITFPFFDPGLISAPDNEIPLYLRVVSPDHPGLYFIGLLQPLGAIMPLAEAQSEWIADVLRRRVVLPSPERMRRAIERDRDKVRKRYVASKRHTIQVDFFPYLRRVGRERGRGRLRRLMGRGGAADERGNERPRVTEAPAAAPASDADGADRADRAHGDGGDPRAPREPASRAGPGDG
jgi:Flavin-binding monooxygenase-like